MIMAIICLCPVQRTYIIASMSSFYDFMTLFKTSRICSQRTIANYHLLSLKPDSLKVNDISSPAHTQTVFTLFIHQPVGIL